MDTIIIFAAQYLIFAIATAALLYIFLRLPKGELREVILLYVIGIVVAIIVVKIVGSIYYNPRPFVDGNFTPLFPHSSTNGFPSDHTVAAILLASLLWRYNWQFATVLFVAACIIGVSRVLAGVHHIEDIIGGIVVAVLAAMFASLAVHYITNRKVTKPDN